MDRRRKLGLVAIVLTIAALFASVSVWIVFEQDIFWQIRAGEELIRTHTFPWVDSWSYSARGQPWLNFQWLSTVLLYLGYAMGASSVDDVAGLIGMRSAAIALLFTLLGAVILTSIRRALRALEIPPLASWPFLTATLLLSTLLPCLYTVLLPRLQLRSDLFVVMVFTVLVWIWQAVDFTSAKQLRRALVATVGCVFCAANLHTGTAPFVVVLAVAYVFARAPTLSSAWGWTLACLSAFFATPYTWHVLPTLYEHLLYNHYNLLTNTDHLPLSWAYFFPSFSTWGWAGVAWLMLSVAAACSVLLDTVSKKVDEIRHKQFPLPRSAWPLLAACAVFTALSINRERSIPYHAIFVLPFATVMLTRMPRAAVAALAACAWLGWHTSAMSMAAVRGDSVHEGLYPVGCAKFIEREHPQGNVFHTFALGAYLVWFMRDRPLYVDTRETMYRPLQSEVIASFQSPEVTQALLRKYDAHTVVMPIPPTRFESGKGFEDVIARFLPSEKWALVYFDKAAFVSVERIPEHAALIAAHEYKVLRPNLPANLYAVSAGRDAGLDAAVDAEIVRCLQNEPDNIYCTVAQAAVLREKNAPLAMRTQAVARLESAVQRAERWNSPQLPHAMLQLHRAYEDVGNVQGLCSIEARLPLWNGAARSTVCATVEGG